MTDECSGAQKYLCGFSQSASRSEEKVSGPCNSDENSHATKRKQSVRRRHTHSTSVRSVLFFRALSPHTARARGRRIGVIHASSA